MQVVFFIHGQMHTFEPEKIKKNYKRELQNEIHLLSGFQYAHMMILSIKFQIFCIYGCYLCTATETIH